MSTAIKRTLIPTATHWGTYYAEVEGDRLLAVHDYEKDPAPAIIGPGIVDAVTHETRVARPHVRKGWLEKRHNSDRTGRGNEPFVAVPWDEALDMAAQELQRVKDEHGNGAMYAGSYGWASAGRFHHANSHIHRFFNQLGGYVSHRGTYSYAAAEAIAPYVVGPFRDVLNTHTTWPVLAEHCELLVMFGGMPVKNAQVTSGGVGRHTCYHGLRDCADAGCELVYLSPIRSDLPPDLGGEWIAPRPGSDMSIMLALAHTLLSEGLHDKAFLERYTTGFAPFEAYLRGETDGQPKTADWAAKISGVDADTIRDLARRMASKRTMINSTWSMQRAEYGEQPIWMTVVLAAMLGQIGLPGGGFGLGYSSENGIGNPVKQFHWPSVPQGINNVGDFIPVARISDMLLNPGAEYDYNGERRSYADIKLVYWAGGNPFHHHQDINQLVRAFQKPDTIIVNEIFWTSMARHADIVFPSTTALERNDLSITHWEPLSSAMKQAIPRVGESRPDYEIFTGLADRLGFAERYTEGRDEMDWIRHLWDQSRQRAAEAGFELPDFETFWEREHVELPDPEKPMVMLEEFRADPDAHRLQTPSGKIEIFSETIDGFGYDDCPGHPVWRAPDEWLGAERAQEFPLHLMSNQPRTRLHSQLDCGQVSQGSKVAGREPMTLHPDDAAARGISSGDIVRVWNDRGACLAGAIVSDQVMPGVIQLSTGAWYDPETPGGLEVHGNPNVLTRDRGTSRLGQGPTAHSTLVEVAKVDGVVPDVTVMRKPKVEG
ncbi:molybdopterin guanine dinucleotide-containing S/N-oxide reductase [Thalassobaculum salexigens]|uniref:molybdopterin guanine dinucleotide-containing S/N-oxide reductase n=1 Tax=Thalassobaculum salexigens TaxID=455360 RepID=UPI000415B445|nr:molybdopterin guanine dinucleotide-containing S/N-oxide reductase [Thalassobaculum salexigens]